MPRPLLPDSLTQLLKPLLEARETQIVRPGPVYGGGDTTAPPMPTGVAATFSLVRNYGGEDTVHAAVSWNAPAAPDDRGKPPVYQHGVRWRVGASGSWSAEVRARFLATSALLTGLPTDTAVTIGVRAITATGSASEYTTITATTPRDATPPPVPSAPTAVSVEPGSVDVFWDGTLTGTLPADFRRVDVHLVPSATGAVTGGNKVGEMTSAATLRVPAAPGTQVFARLVAVDRYGNASAASTASAGVTPRSLAASLGEIGGANAVRNATFQLNTSGSSAPDYWSWSAGAPWVWSATLGRGTFGTHCVTLDYTPTATESPSVFVATPDRPPVITGRSYVPSVWVYVSSVSTAAARSKVGLLFRFEDEAGTVIGDTVTASTDGSTLNRWVRVVAPKAVAPANATRMRLYGRVDGLASGERIVARWDDMQIDEGEVATAFAPRPSDILPGTITATEIGPDSITTPKLAAEAVVAAKIAAAAITADKIAVGALTADKIATSTLQAGVTITVGTPGGDRIEITGGSSGGIRLYRSGNATPRVDLGIGGDGTFRGALSGATGTFTGTVEGAAFRTATTGRRVVINDPVAGAGIYPRERAVAFPTGLAGETSPALLTLDDSNIFYVLGYNGSAEMRLEPPIGGAPARVRVIASEVRLQTSGKVYHGDGLSDGAGIVAAGVEMVRTSSYAVSANAWTRLQYNSATRSDADGKIGRGTGTTARIICNNTGWYMVNATATLTGVASGTRIALALGTSAATPDTGPVYARQDVTAASTAVTLTVTAIMYRTAGDTVACYVNPAAAATVAANSSTDVQTIDGIYLGPAA